MKKLKPHRKAWLERRQVRIERRRKRRGPGNYRPSKAAKPEEESMTLRKILHAIVMRGGNK